jgi:extracellular elastinolytic metalloproteinase
MKKIIFFLTTLFFLSAQASQSPDLVSIHQHIAGIFGSKNYVPNYRITNTVHSSGNTTIYYGCQQVAEIPIFQSEFIISITNQKVSSFRHKFILDAEKLIVNKNFLISPNKALSTVTQLSSQQCNKLSEQEANVYILNDHTLSDAPIKVIKMWVILGTMGYPAYDVSFYQKNQQHWYNTRVSALDARIINQNDWVTHCDLERIGHYSQDQNPLKFSPRISQVETKNKKAASASYMVFARPRESPNHGSRTLEVGPEDAQASPFGWHDINGAIGEEFTITKGNNVYASEDIDDLDLPGNSPDGGSSLTFNDVFDITKSAELYQDAAITNLFYWNNLMHDIWWHYGFDESSGNFQFNNYSRGGLAADEVFADAQDGSGTNNANFATPPDGQNPRMQMYLWQSSAISNHIRVNSPATIASDYISGLANFGPRLTTTPINGKLVVVDDGSANGNQGCFTLTNASAIAGNIAFIKRRNCNFSVKVKNAQNAGAIAAVIYSEDDNPITMGGTDNTITIPSVHIRNTDALAILNALKTQNVTVSLYDSTQGTIKTYDSDFDNGIIAHEYGHGISNRLTGGAAASNCLSNEEQMGEGWSDFFSLVMTHDGSDSAKKLRGIGTYVLGELITGGGIRTYPYTTDITKSPYTYNDIKRLSVPHGVGSVWCSMLWDLYWAMIDKHGYDSDIYNGTGGNNMAMKLVIDGLKLQPCNPGFEDGRNAIILADKNGYNGANELLIWQVFARRGLGFGATQGSTDDRGDGTENFEIPPYLLSDLIIKKSTETKAINSGILNYKLVASNRSQATVRNIVLTDKLDNQVTYVTSSLTKGTYTNGIITISQDSLLPGDSMVITFDVKLAFGKTSVTTFTDDMQNGTGNWEVAKFGASGNWILQDLSGIKQWYAKNEVISTDLYLTHSFDLKLLTNPLLLVNHKMNSEDQWDGGVIEIKADGGNWIDAAPYLNRNGYNGQIQNNPASAISNRMAFTGNTKGYIETQIDLADFRGQSISVRFRFASDGAAAEDGWYVSNVELLDAVSLPNIGVTTYGDDGTSRDSVSTLVFGAPINNMSSIHSEKIKIYPNPATTQLIIKGIVLSTFSYKLMDISGKTVQMGESKGISTLNIEGLAAGLYDCAVTIEREILHHKIIIQ